MGTPEGSLTAALDGDGELEAAFQDGEMRLTAGGTPVLSKIYLEDEAGRLTQAYWRFLLLSREPNGAKQFAAELRRPPAPTRLPAATQFAERVGHLGAETATIAASERKMNERLFGLYRLTQDEQLLVERRKR